MAGGHAPRAAPGRLAADQGHAAPVLPGARQDPPGDDAAAQPLVERAALRRRTRAHDASSPPPWHDVRHQPRLCRPRRRRARGRRPDRRLRAARGPRRRRVRPAPARRARRAGRRRGHPRGAVRRPDDDPVPVRPRTRGLGPRVHRALLGDAELDRPCARGVQRLVQGQDQPGPPVLARPRPRRHPLLRSRRPARRRRSGDAGGLLQRGDLVRVLGGRRQPGGRRLLLLHGTRARWPTRPTAGRGRVDGRRRRHARDPSARDGADGCGPADDAARLPAERVRGGRPHRRLGHLELRVRLVPDSRPARGTAREHRAAFGRPAASTTVD